jgi:hypothetical protein
MKPLLRVVFKGLILFLLVNILLGLGRDWKIGSLSLYNTIFPGRPRLPFGEMPQDAYNFSLSNLDAMLASQAVHVKKPGNEYRVLIIGDSSVWGTLLRPEETLAGRLNQDHLRAPDGREFVLAEIADFDREITLVRQHDALMQLLAERSKDPARYTLAQVREELAK